MQKGREEKCRREVPKGRENKCRRKGEGNAERKGAEVQKVRKEK